jgi:hypothetical protein
MSTIKANTLLHSDGSTTTQPSIPALDQRMAKAWVSYNHGGNLVKDSYNVSSMTDRGTGLGTLNFSTAMSDANYAVLGLDIDGGGEDDNRIFGSSGPFSTSSFNWFTGYVSSTITAAELNDGDRVSIMVFGS